MLVFVTADDTAYAEVSEHLAEFAQVERVEYDYVRIQHEDLEEIAGVGAADAHDNGPIHEALPEADDDATETTVQPQGDRPPVVVEQTGLFLDALDGFPGPYMQHAADTLGVDRVWRLCEAADPQTGVLRTAVAYADDERVVTFEGARDVSVVAPEGPQEAGFERMLAIEGTRLATLPVAQKNAISPRARAFTKLADWLIS